MMKNINKNKYLSEISLKKNIFDKSVFQFLTRFQSEIVKQKRIAKDFLEKKNYCSIK